MSQDIREPDVLSGTVAHAVKHVQSKMIGFDLIAAFQIPRGNLSRSKGLEEVAGAP